MNLIKFNNQALKEVLGHMDAIDLSLRVCSNSAKPKLKTNDSAFITAGIIGLLFAL